MIREIRIKNFKAFGQEQRIPVKPITLLYGANSSGKSSILQAILMFVQSFSKNNRFTGQLIPDGEKVKLGSFKNIVHNHIEDGKIKISFGLDKRFMRNEKYFTLKADSKLHTLTSNFSFTFANKAYNPDVFVPVLRQIDFGLSCDADYFIRYASSDGTFFTIININNSELLEVEKKYLIKILRESNGIDSSIKSALEDSIQNHLNKELLFAISCSKYQIKLSPFNYLKYESINYDGLYLTMVMYYKNIFKNFNLYNLVSSLCNKKYDNIFEKNSPVLVQDSMLSIENYVAGVPEWLKDQLPSDVNGKHKYLRKLNEKRTDSNSSSSDYKIPSLNFSGIAFEDILEMLVYLNKTRYVGPLRSFPKRYYLSDKSQSGFSEFDPTGENIAEILYSTKDLIENINYWFAKLGIPYTIDVSCNKNEDLTVYSIKIINPFNISVTPADVGFGVSQILPVIINLITSNNQLVMIEQPEIHLHPKLQTQLADLLIDSAKNKNNKIIAETHSEHLLLRIMRRIRETTNGKLDDASLALKPEDVAVLYVESVNGESVVHELRLDEQGDFIDKWPQGFFDERLDEIF